MLALILAVLLTQGCIAEDVQRFDGVWDVDLAAEQTRFEHWPLFRGLIIKTDNDVLEEGILRPEDAEDTAQPVFSYPLSGKEAATTVGEYELGVRLECADAGLLMYRRDLAYPAGAVVQQRVKFLEDGNTLLVEVPNAHSPEHKPETYVLRRRGTT